MVGKHHRRIGHVDYYPERGARRDDASSGIFGVWFAKPGFDDDEEAGIWGGDIELTAQGAAIRDQYAPSSDANPFISCTRGIPEIMTGFGPVEFSNRDDGILLRFGEFDIVRPIMMGPGAEADRPPKWEAGAHGDVGYSTGYWQDDNTLVVRTTGMSYPYYDQSGLPQSPDAEILERWTLADDGNALRYELTVIDPAAFARPVVQTKTWHWAPDRKWCLTTAIPPRVSGRLQVTSSGDVAKMRPDYADCSCGLLGRLNFLVQLVLRNCFVLV